MQGNPGRIILLNGASSAGKTTLARALRPALEPQFHYCASEQLADAAFRPSDPEIRSKWREAFFDGFHHSIASFANAGLDLLVEHIVEKASWAESLAQILKNVDVFWVGVHAPQTELAHREWMRKDRHPGEALEHLGTHRFCRYDVEVDTTAPTHSSVDRIVTAWRARSPS